MTQRTDHQLHATNEGSPALLTFGGHLEVLRKMLLRIVLVTILIAILVFYFKDETFAVLLAPHEPDFISFRWIESVARNFGWNIVFDKQQIPLISTDLSAQFMTHISVSCLMAILLASPYILWELFRFISPALYQHERRYSSLFAFAVYGLFVIGLAMSYFVIFPVSFKFLATYQVDNDISNTITLDSYVTTFTTLTFLMGVVFQLPILVLVMAKMGLINSDIMKKYRPYAFILIMVVAAVITPPDIFTLILVALPIYLLYETSILLLTKIHCKSQR